MTVNFRRLIITKGLDLGYDIQSPRRCQAGERLPGVLSLTRKHPRRVGYKTDWSTRLRNADAGRCATSLFNISTPATGQGSEAWPLSGHHVYSTPASHVGIYGIGGFSRIFFVSCHSQTTSAREFTVRCWVCTMPRSLPRTEIADLHRCPDVREAVVPWCLRTGYTHVG